MGCGGGGKGERAKGETCRSLFNKISENWESHELDIYIYIYIYISLRKHSYIKISRFQKINIFDRSDLHGS